MGLTQNKEITELQKLVSQLKDKINQLEAVIFQKDILSEPDSDWDTVRNKRNYLLKLSDWTLIPGVTVDQRAWSSYRQNLRDLPQTYAKYGLDKLVWPVPPSIAGPNTTPVE